MSAAVRRARREDADTLLDLIDALADYEKLSRPDLEARARLVNDIFGEKPRLDAFLAELDGQSAGYALVLETYSSFLARPTLYLEDLFVRPECRGRNVGGALLRAMVREATERGCARMEWVVLDWNQPAIEFYEHFGARRLSDWKTYRLLREEMERILAAQDGQ